MFKLHRTLYFLSFICTFNKITVSSTDIQIQIGNFNRGTPEKTNIQISMKKLNSNKSIQHSKQLMIGSRHAVWIKPRVVGGWKAKLGEVPYQVSLKRYDKFTWRSFCGGSIISNNKVLSAAHCIASHRDMSLCLARLGVRNLPLIGDFSRTLVVAGSIVNRSPSIPNSNSTSQWRRIKRILVPDDYNFPMSDISLITLQYPFVFNHFVAPVPLASKKTHFSECLIAGYGNTYDPSNNNLFSDYLMYSKVIVMDKPLCDSAVKGDTYPFVCTDDTYKTATGVGDSGGPLVCKKPQDPNDQGYGVLVGIVCAGTYRKVSVYSRVALYKEFIAKGCGIHFQGSPLLMDVLTSNLNIEIQFGNITSNGTRNIRISVKPSRNHLDIGRRNLFNNRKAIWNRPKELGGLQAKLGDVPYLVSLKRLMSGSWKGFCGGSILKADKVLTAAHCVAVPRETPKCLTRLGWRQKPVIKHFTRIYAVAGCLFNIVPHIPDIDTAEFGQWRKIKKVSVPNNYLFPTNDVSVITLRFPFIFNDFIDLIPLASENNYEYSHCIIAGFGATEYSRHFDYLKYAKVSILPQDICEYVLEGITPIVFVCSDDEKQSASAKGDSGGPLVCRKPKDPNDKGYGVLVGVVCAGFNSVSIYSRVSPYIDFITKSSVAICLQEHRSLLLLNVILICLYLIQYQI